MYSLFPGKGIELPQDNFAGVAKEIYLTILLGNGLYIDLIYTHY